MVYEEPPNKACSGQWGFCGIFGFIYTQAESSSLSESTPAPLPLTQTVETVEKGGGF
jgi:hypothetical protein